MTSPGTRPLPGPFIASMAYAVRACVPPKRWALLAVPAAAAVLIAFLTTLDDSGDTGLELLLGALLGFVVPFSCLIVGDAVLGAERRSGLLTLTWLSPAPFATVVAGRWLAGWLVAAVALLPAMALAALVAGEADAIGVLLVATVFSAAAYVAIFMAFGVLTRRGMLWSLGFVMVGEQTVAPLLSSLAQLSPGALGQAVYAGLGPGGDELLRSGVPSGWWAVVRLVVLSAVALAVTERALRRVTILSGED